MPRTSRIAFPGFPHHIVQRGHRQGDVFFSEFDRMDYLATLAECRDSYGLKVYAFCLMSNHVHLIVQPGDDASTLSALMKRLAGRHARRLNRLHNWRGSLWESRFKCSPIDTDAYLLTCGRYVDQNPVRARMVKHPADFIWSSYCARAGLNPCPWLDTDPALQSLASTEQRRWEIYREIAATPQDERDLELVRGALQRNQLTGGHAFVTQIECLSGKRVSTRKRGRPRKT